MSQIIYSTASTTASLSVAARTGDTPPWDPVTYATTMVEIARSNIRAMEESALPVPPVMEDTLLRAISELGIVRSRYVSEYLIYIRRKLREDVSDAERARLTDLRAKFEAGEAKS